jgi:hypothetical protein
VRLQLSFDKLSSSPSSSSPAFDTMPQIMHHPDDDDGEDDERCQVCDDGSWDDDDLIVFCEGDGCGIVVHQSCYGILKVPKGDTPWFCNACKQGAGEEDLVRVDTLVPNLLRRQLLTKTQNAPARPALPLSPPLCRRSVPYA